MMQKKLDGILLNDIFWSDEVAPILPNVLQEGLLN